jgi:hypothetical protein
MIRGLLPLYLSGAMNAAASEGTPPLRPGDKKIKITPCPVCLGEDLKRGTFEYSTIFMVWM